MSKQQIDVSKIQTLALTLEPASEKLSSVLKLIGQLDSQDYYVREEAEQELMKIGRRFRSVIQRTSSLKTNDGKYRLNRMLSSLRVKPNEKSGVELDLLVLADGTKLAGDAGTGNFQVMFQGKTITLQRNRLSRITQATPIRDTRTVRSELVTTKLYHNHAEFMQDRELKRVDFENKPNGTALGTLDKNISSTFVEDGLVLGTEFPKGCVGISVYNIKAGDKPVGGNSICVYQSISGSRTGKRFQGVMEITFCQPGKKNIPHGVKDFGLFLSRVNHSRDMIVEAWDSMDRLIGVCESNDEPCTFCGISSSVPIAKIRVLSNPWILDARKLSVPPEQQSRQRVDKDYAVDSIMYSAPVPTDSINKDRHFLGRNGDVIPLTWVRVFDKERIEFGSLNFQLLATDLDSASSFAFRNVPKSLPKKLNANSAWMAMLSDNSILRWDPRNPLRSTRLGETLALKDVVAIWPTGRQPQVPLQGDFQLGNNVLVYPGCRVTTSAVDFDEKGFRWNKGTLRTAMLHDENEFKVDARTDDIPDNVAPRKKNYSFDVSSLLDFEIPTIWFKPPTTVPAKHGVIRLDNDEVIVYGVDSSFQLRSMDKSQVSLTFRGDNISIPLTQVVSILPMQE